MGREEADHRISEMRRFLQRSLPLLAGRGAGTPDEPEITPLAGDGSRRSFYRVQLSGTTAVLVDNRLPPERTHPDENEAFFAVRNFLSKRKLRVPALFAADLERGFLLIEDLGDLRLFDLVQRGPEDTGTYAPFYDEAVDALIDMQSPKGPAYDPAMTSNPAYTVEFILEHESGYFHRELVRAVADPDHAFDEIAAECRHLAERARSVAPASPASHNVFMHRDFQSRNLMVTGGSLALIDFQGARPGPPEYDLAALLYDPYVALPAALRRRLLLRYLRGAAAAEVAGIPRGDPPAHIGSPSLGAEWLLWQRRFLANAANRLMQALGAFAKLGVREGRAGFREHIPTALGSLRAVLEERGDCPALLSLVTRLQARKID